jgi:hypothetical protein
MRKDGRRKWEGDVVNLLVTPATKHRVEIEIPEPVEWWSIHPALRIPDILAGHAKQFVPPNNAHFPFIS